MAIRHTISFGAILLHILDCTPKQSKLLLIVDLTPPTFDLIEPKQHLVQSDNAVNL